MEQNLNLILVEDMVPDAELLLRQLRRAGFTPRAVRVDDEAALVEALGQPVDIVLSDFDMPKLDGFRALEIVRAHAPETPFILVSGTMGEEIAVEAMRRGASDYLLKDRLARLGQAVNAVLTQARAHRERLALETAMAETEARFRQLFENATEGIFQLDETFRLLIANPALAGMFGFESPLLMKEQVDDFSALLCADASERERTLGEIRSNGSVTRKVIRGAKSDGHPIWLSLNARLGPASGGDYHIEGSVDDITERKGLEAQLLRAQRLESVGRLAGGVAHDINNILVPVLMGAGLLRARLTDPDLQSLLETMEASARRGAAMVKQLLQFSRGATGARVAIEPMDLVKDMLDIMRETFPKNIVVRARRIGDPAAIEGDPTQLHQIIMNLCVNARDAMTEGGELEIVVETREVDAATPVTAGQRPKPGKYVCVTVCDSGTGIDPEHLERIFDPFFTTKELGHGTGLGLCTVLGIVKSHGGFIHIDTHLWQGTRFSIYLPSPGALEPVRQARATRPPTHGRAELILVVDDEAPIRTIISRVLTAGGYRAIEAPDGREGVARFVEHMHEIRLIITDVMMPNMDGISLLRAIRSLDPNVPIVATSGAGKHKKTEMLQSLGVAGMLGKPFTKDDLLTEVERVLARRRDVASP